MGVKGIKGFNKGMICDKFNCSKQYAENTEYEEKVIPSCCSAGMHIVENPLDVFSYYAPGESEYAEVEAIGDVARHDGDSKISTNKLRVGLKIDLKGVIKAGIDFIFEKTKSSPDTIATTGEGANAATTGYCANAATTGRNTIAAAIGINSMAKASLGNWIVVAEWKWLNGEWTPVCVKATKVDGTTIKADTYYKLQDGEFVESKEA